MNANLSKPSDRRLRRWFETGPLATMQREMEELFDSFMGGEPIAGEATAIAPRIDLAETDDSVEVTTDLPGVAPEEVKVELQDNCLVITAEHSEERKEEDGKRFHRVERRRGRYSRSVWLPSPVDESKVEAKLENGVLKVTLSKTTEAQRRRIPVNG